MKGAPFGINFMERVPTDRQTKGFYDEKSHTWRNHNGTPSFSGELAANGTTTKFKNGTTDED